MPASNIGSSYLQDARNNFDAVRPAPICTDANQSIGQCQNVHISTNCYYGYHDLKRSEDNHVDTDCEMMELPERTPSKTTTSRKRSADEEEFPQRKRIREEVQREKTIEPETNETVKLDSSAEDISVMESLYWNIHGGNIFHLIQCL
ncbi:uncharacterized protein LOC118263572 isoform X1 [Spodoptera frugiperda]|uniref:Uncharacterized protein LOC118263572 isoform X1 n=1 Tax=Spodoptera frugiperda TaxID=7108 RepID=A0A9R0CWG0_SPOFR|nr:uncharacterized protein LOC118263572 isoform X1 [Spodoptera frugiperda]